MQQNTLKKHLNYDPLTGIFTWLFPKAHGMESGDIAGSKHTSGYNRINLTGKVYLAHRLAWLYVYGQFPDKEIDHINGIRDDNRICNLRSASSQENSRNRAIGRNNISGVTGVSWSKRNSLWIAGIKINNKRKQLIATADFFEAVCSRRSAEIKYGFHPNHGKR